MMVTRNTRLIDATVGDLLDLLKQEQGELPEMRYVYGLSGLAALFGCSKRAAANLKSSGKIDEAIIQNGRKIVIDANLALELVQKHQR